MDSLLQKDFCMISRLIFKKINNSVTNNFWLLSFFSCYFLSYSFLNILSKRDLGSSENWWVGAVVWLLTLLTMFALWLNCRRAKQKVWLIFSCLVLSLLSIYIPKQDGSSFIYIKIICLSTAFVLYAKATYLDDIIYFLDKNKYAAILPYVVFGLSYLALGLIRHYSFNSHAFDLGLFAQAFYNFSHFDLSNSIKGVSNLWGDHFHPILFPLSFIYRIFPTAVTLIVLQTIFIILGGLPVYWLSNEFFKSRSISFFIVVSYFSFFGISSALQFDFHEITIAATFFLFAFYFLIKRKWGYYFLFILFYLSCKENLGIMVAALGIFILFWKRKYWKVALATFVLGAVWFFCTTEYLIPYFAGQDYVYFEYKQLGENVPKALKTVFLNPLQAISKLFDHPDKLRTFYLTFGSFVFLPFASPLFLILALPALGENLWNDNMHRWGGFHYGVGIAPILVIAVIFAINKITCWTGKFNLKIAQILAVLVALNSIFFGIYARESIFLLLNPARYQNKFLPSTMEAIKSIPSDASVSAQHSLVPHLSSRKKIYSYPGCRPEDCGNSDYYIFSLKASKYPYNKLSDLAADIKNFVLNSDYGLYFYKDEAFVFKKGYNPSEIDVDKALSFLEGYIDE